MIKMILFWLAYIGSKVLFCSGLALLVIRIFIVFNCLWVIGTFIISIIVYGLLALYVWLALNGKINC